MKNQELNLLFVFDAIMTEGSVTRAAERLSMTQPAVSNAISRMRHQWRDPLFIKSGRNIEPTSYALNLWQQIRGPMLELSTAVESNQFDPTTSTRRFRVGVSDLMVDLMWLPLRQVIETEAPGVSIHAIPYSPERVSEFLIHAQADLLIGPFHDSFSDIRTSWLFDSHMALGMRAGHPLAGKPVSLEDFVAADHLLVSLSGDASGYVDRLLREMGHSRRVAMTVNHFSSVPKLLACSNLITIAPIVVLGREEFRDQLWVTQPPLDLKPKAARLCWHARHDNDPGVTWLRERIQQVVANESRKCVRCAEKSLGERVEAMGLEVA